MFSPSLPLSLSGSESEDTASSDSPTAIIVLPLSHGGTTTSLSQKRKTGRKKFKATRHPVYRGVRHRNGGKWVCEVREPNKKSRVWLGTYPTAELAARAYDVGALALRGEQTAFNFPDSVQLAPKPKSSSARDIRLAALQATRYDLTRPSSSTISSHDDCKIEEEEHRMFWDEEELFNMPTLINSMAEGMLITPPALKKGVNWDEIYPNNEYDSYVSLDLW